MAPKKKVSGLIKLQIQAGAANPAPPVGPASNPDEIVATLTAAAKARNPAAAMGLIERLPPG